MNHWKIFRLILVFIFGFLTAARAQFYAPDTEFHDKAQRLFVVEATRILAWRENAGSQTIAEIKYHVAVNTDRTTVWQMRCLNDRGEIVKQFKVSYPEDLLLQGPHFYRETFKQIWREGKWSIQPTLASGDLNRRYWEGAELTGMARDEGLQAAFKLCPTNGGFKDAETASALAGLLTHIPLPSLSGGVTLDATLLARGAAWLALSESMLQENDAPADENWALILFMAGREYAAEALWKNTVKPNTSPPDPRVLFDWWNCLLRQPKARDAFLFAAQPKERRYALPMMAYYSEVSAVAAPLVDVLEQLFGDDISGWYDYGAFLCDDTVFGSGQSMGGGWPAIFRSKWLETLKSLPVSALDFKDFTQKANAIAIKTEDASEAADPCLIGLKQFAPLLELGREERTGKLIPVAVVTARDLLNYGWEMNGCQMGARYHFVNNCWGVPELGKKILKDSLNGMEGELPFFLGEQQTKMTNKAATYRGLQMVDCVAWRSDVMVHPFGSNLHATNAAQIFYKRCWLNPAYTQWQCWALDNADLKNETVELLKRYHEEGGLKSEVIGVQYINSFGNKELNLRPKLREIREQMGEDFLDPTSLQAVALFRKRMAKLSYGARAQAYEKIFWQNPDCGLEAKVLEDYILAGAWKSADRFYRQARETVSIDLSFSNELSPMAWAAGFLTKNEDLMKLAVKDSDTASYACMQTEAWNAAALGNYQKTKACFDGIIQRYEPHRPNSEAHVLKKFMSLLPALQDSNNPKHQEALNYFRQKDLDPIFRWIVIQNCKLEEKEAINFFGGTKNDVLRQMVTAYFQNKPDVMKEAFKHFAHKKDQAASPALAGWLNAKMSNKTPGIEEKDLKPPGAKSIAQAVKEAIEK